MKRNVFFGVSIATLMFATVSCGGAEEEATEGEGETIEVVEDVVEAVEYTVDTEASIINWYNMEGEEKGHYGTTKIMEGSYTMEGDVITAASLTMDLNTITVDDEMGGEKLLGHIISPDLLDVAQFGTATFTFGGHADGMVTGTLNVAGADTDVNAPVTVGEGSIEVGDFQVDMAHLPMFAGEREGKPEAEWHDAGIGFTATIIAQ